ncbi:MAG: sugar phosphate isomerase/epimerase [Candidatus Latescibacteria bacterium]|nr:sugar phosphate isomerase/epimerase [Candidatus Latescibacterota bacterium]
MKLSWMTYGVLKDLSRQDLLQTLSDHGVEGVEFRTDLGHGHGVEASLDDAERRQVVADCRAAGIEIISVATGNRYHDVSASDLRDQIEQTKVRMDLAADLGAPRVRVFGNNFPKDVPREKTIAQVAEALQELCSYGVTRGVRPSLELHGEFDWRSCSAVAGKVDHENFGLIWNSVAEDVVDGSVAQALDTVWPWLDHVHMHDLAGQGYPYRELFRLLHRKEYDGYMSAEAERSPDRGVGDRWMFAAYYADLFRAYRDLARG